MEIKISVSRAAAVGFLLPFALIRAAPDHYNHAD
jgi:hypothetical protein